MAARVNAGPSLDVTVLLVDDDPAIRFLLRLLLERAGLGLVVVAEAGSAQEGFALWERFRPDVLVLDEQMPMMTGTQLARMILTVLPTQHLVLCTGLPLDQRGEALALGLTTIGKEQLTAVPALVRELAGVG